MKLCKKLITFALIFICFVFVSCGENKTNNIAEKITLADAVLSEIEFENSEETKIKQNGDTWIVSGNIEKMSLAQKNAFGVSDVEYVVVLKFEFDKERTIDAFELKGSVTKVFSTDETDENYVGSITELLDNEESEDAFCYLILSAETKDYTFTSKYSDGTTSKVKLKINATLVSSNPE